ncbi:hypothetical protein NXS19_009204 [Fusarium pseudograminearum]|nr:hypothetical protein NXS19_009204 [Fusarium pseudograminearum]
MLNLQATRFAAGFSERAHHTEDIAEHLLDIPRQSDIWPVVDCRFAARYRGWFGYSLVKAGLCCSRDNSTASAVSVSEQPVVNPRFVMHVCSHLGMYIVEKCSILVDVSNSITSAGTNVQNQSYIEREQGRDREYGGSRNST